MAEKKAQEVEVKNVKQVEAIEPLEKMQSFWEQNKKRITTIAAAVIVICGGWYIYKNYFAEPKEERAADAIFKAEQYFQQDSLNLALNGDGQNKGFLYVIKNFGGTASENLAHFYAGVIYLRNHDYNNAIKHLKDFDADGTQIQMLAYGRLGDAYSEAGKKDEAIDYYKKAGHYFPKDDINSSEFLFRAGYLLEAMGKNTDALELYKEIRDKYPRTDKGFTIDKYIYRLSIEKNDFSVKE